MNLPSNGVGYIGVNHLCHGVTNLFNVKNAGIMKNKVISNHPFVECKHSVSGVTGNSVARKYCRGDNIS